MTTEFVLEDVLKRLADGETPSAIVAGSRTGELALLRRCAVVRTFDASLFEVLRRSAAPTRVGFEEIVATPEIEPVPRRDGVYRVREGARARLWNAWWADGAVTDTLPEELEKLVRAVLVWLGDDGDVLERLSLTALVDEDAAVRLLREQYAAADRRFDLATCRDLIGVLEDPLRSPLLGGDALKPLRDDRATYLRARSLWSVEHFNTATYVEPAGALDMYAHLLGPDGPSVLNVHAQGGRGKSIQLKWLISRVLVPEPAVRGDLGGLLPPRRIPCARVDFDFVDPVNITRFPWLLLIELGAQLDEQVAGRPFGELFRDHGWAAPLLRRDPSDRDSVDRASKRMQTESQTDRQAVSAQRKFVQAVRENIAHEVLMVLDTLEEVHLRPQGDLQSLVRLLAELLEACDGLRIVLAGRYDIRRILGSSADILGEMQDEELGPLRAPVALRYLDRRRVERPEVRDAIVAKADGDPFVLSLLADIAQIKPGIAPAEISGYPADVIYLIRRVVSRIHEPGVRWLLRYGVVPRTLNLDFVRNVMMPHVRAGMAGREDLDAPDRDDLPDELDEDGAPFPKTRRRAPSAEALWEQLRRYAGSTSWVYEDPADPRGLRFRADVRVAMRKVIRPRDIYARLHKEAVAHFEALAKQEPSSWERWTREALYHRFQLEGEAAYEDWRRALAEAGYSPSRREAIASELLEPDYVDPEGSPLPWDDERLMVPRHAVVEAHVERAAALTELARLEHAQPDGPLWSQAERSLEQAEHLAGDLEGAVVPPGRIAYVRAGLLLRDGRHEEAERELREALSRSEDRLDLARLRVLLGDAQLARGDLEAAATYREALATARGLPRAGKWLVVIRRRLVLAERERDRLDEAAAESAKALRGATTGRPELELIAGEIALRAGQFHAADERARSVLDDSRDWRASAVRVDAALALGHPLRAVGLLEEAGYRRSRTTSSTSGLDLGRLAGLDEIAGRVAGALMDFSWAFSSLDRARGQWQTEGDLDAVMRCYLTSAWLKLRGTGDIGVAQQHLDEASRLLSADNADGRLELDLLRQALHAARGERAKAEAACRETLERLLRTAAPPRQLIRAAAEGLAVCAPRERAGLLDVLIEQCAQVTPSSARIVLLEPLERAPAIVGPDAATRLERLRSLVDVGRDTRLTAPDRAALALTLAELDRVAGERETALERLGQAAREVRANGPIFHARALALAGWRLGLTLPDDETAAAFLERFVSCPILCADFLLYRADALRPADPAASEALVDRAESLLADAPEEQTLLHVRVSEARAAQLRARGQSGAFHEAAAVALRAELGHPAHEARAQTDDDPLSELDRHRVRLSVGAFGALHPAVAIQLSNGPLEPFDFDFLDWLLADWIGAGKELGDLLLAGDLEAALAGPGPELPLRLELDSRRALELDSRRVSAIPWELARLPGGDLLPLAERVEDLTRAVSGFEARRAEAHFLQLALNRVIGSNLPVDRYAGPGTADTLRAYQRAIGVPADGRAGMPLLDRLQRDLAAKADGPPVVVLVQPSEGRQLAGQRGSASYDLDLSGVYRSVGFEVLTIENPDLEEIQSAIRWVAKRGTPPDILHLSGGLRESAGRLTFSFLAGDWLTESWGGSRYAEDLPVTALDHLLEQFPRESLRPLLILDIDRPRGVSETMSQLLMRNAFAYELFALGHCPALLAGGLVEGDQAGLAYSRLAHVLSGGASVSGAAQVVRRLIPPKVYDLAAAIGPVGTALFTHLPWLRPTLR